MSTKNQNRRGQNQSRQSKSARRVLALAASLAVMGMTEVTWAGKGTIQVERVSRGSATFQQRGDNTLIRAADRTIINYRRFDVPGSATVTFRQPSSTSRVLNRINSSDPSQIEGTIRSNGTLYFVNPAGITFGPNAVLDVGQLFAAAGTISDSNFLSGVNRFEGLHGSVVNFGSIEAGAVSLVGREVANYGSISGLDGAVTMVSGQEVLIGQRQGHVFVKIDAAQLAGSETKAGDTMQPGAVRLGSGDLISLAVRNSGRVKSKQIVLDAGKGTATVSGALDASEKRAGEKGGGVQVLGDQVAIRGATIDASGQAGGGTVLVGGDFQGKGDVARASKTLVDKDSTIKADAVVKGDGGKVVVWSDQVTGFLGKIIAKGGAAGGNGGNVEVSGKEKLIYQGRVDVSAPKGVAGQVLIDPASITIQAADPDINGDLTSGDDITGLTDLDDAATKFPGAASIITNTAVDGLLTGNSTLVLAATTNIDVDAAVTGAGNASLTLNTPTVNLREGITLAGTGVLSGTPTTVNVFSGAKIQNGIDVLAAGAANTVNVAAGTYSESLSITKAMTLKGANFGVDGHAARVAESIITSAGPVTTLVNVGANNVTIDGFKIQGNSGGAGVTLSSGLSGYQLKNNIITNNVFGVDLGSNGVIQTVVSHNWLDSNNQAGGASGDAIYNDIGAKNILIDSNTFTGHSSASMVFAGVAGQQDQITVSNNTFTSDNSAVFVNTTNLTINNNVFSATQGSAIYLGGNNSTVIIHENDIKNGVSNGIKVVDGEFGNYGTNSGITVANNYIDGNNIGIYIGGGGAPGLSGTMTVQNNHVAGNTTAGFQNNSTVTVDATNNWWGSANGPNVAVNTFNVTSQGDVASGLVTFVTWLNGSGSSSASPSFTPTGIAFAPATLGVGNYSNVQDALNAAAASGDTINLATGTFTESFDNTGKVVTLHFLGNGGFADAPGTLALGAELTITGAGFVTLGDEIAAGNNKLTVDTKTGLGGAVTLNKALTYGSQDVALKSNGLLTINAGITGVSGNLALEGTTVTQAAVTVDAGSGKISIDGGAGVVTTGPLTTTSNNAQAIKVFNASALHVDGAMSAVNGTAALTVGTGDLDQTAKIEASALSIGAGGPITLTDAGNAVGTLTISGAGGLVQFTNAANLMVGGIAGSGYDVTLTADVGGPWTLGQGGIINTGANQLALDGWGVTTLNSANTVAKLLVTNGARSVQFTDAANLDVQGIAGAGQTVTLTAGAGGPWTLGQTAGVINAGELDLSTWGVTTLNRANTVGVLKVAAAAGNAGFTDAGNLDVQGIAASGFDVTLTAGAGGPWSLGQTAGVINTGSGKLTLDQWGVTTLNRQNTVAKLVVTNGVGNIGFTNAGNLDVQGIGASGFDVALTAGAGGPWTLGQTADIINTGANELALDQWGNTTLNSANTVAKLAVTNGAGFVQFTNAGNLDVQGIGAAGQTVTLTASGAGRTLGQTVGIINGSELDLASWNTTTLNAANTVGVLKVTGAAGPVGFTNAGNLDVQGIGAAGQTVTLTAGAGGPWTLGQTAGVINAGELDLSTWGVTTLNRANTVGVLKVVGATGSLGFTNAAALDVQGIAAAGQDVALVVNGAGLTISQTVTAGTFAATADGGTTIGTAAIATNGFQDYGNAVTLGVDTTLTGSPITFGSTVNGPFNLTVNGAVNLNGGSVTTTGKAQQYSGQVTLGASANLTGTTVTFLDKVVGSGNGLTVTGNAVFGDAAADTVTGLSVLHVTGTSGINTNTVTSAGAQDYDGAVTLGVDTTLTGSPITFGSTVNGTGVGTESLAVVGNVVFGGPMGNGKALQFLTVNGTSGINGGSVATSNAAVPGDGYQQYSGPVTLGADATLSGTALTLGAVTGGGKNLILTGSGLLTLGDAFTTVNNLTVNGAGTTTIGTAAITTNGFQNYGNAVTLSVDTTLSGTALTLGAVTGGGKNLILTGSGLLTLGDAFTTVNNLTVNGAGTTTIGTAAIATNGFQNYGNAVTLGVDTTLTGSPITFGSTVNGTGVGTESLAVVGNVVFGGPVGNGKALQFLTVNGTSGINGGSVATSNAAVPGDGYQQYSGPVTLGANTTLKGPAVAFASTVDGGKSLAVNAGRTTFGGAVGSTSALASLLTDTAGTTAINGGSVKTSGGQTYNDAVTLGTNTTLNGSAVTFVSTVDGGSALTVNATGMTTFFEAVGKKTALLRLLTDAAGTTVIKGGSITTKEEQEYGDAVVLTQDTTLSGSIVEFRSTTDGTVAGAESLTLRGNTTLDKAVGSATPLEFLEVGGTTRINGGSVRTGGHQMYRGTVTLGADVTLSSTDADITIVGEVTDQVGGSSLVMEAMKITVSNMDVGGNIEFHADTTVKDDLAAGLITLQGEQIKAGGSIKLGEALSAIPANATIVAEVPKGATYLIEGNSVEMGTYQKLAAAGTLNEQKDGRIDGGSLEINASTTATIGDLIAMENVTVRANEIRLMLRPKGPLYFAQGDGIQKDADLGVDFVAGGILTFDGSVSTAGDSGSKGFTVPRFGDFIGAGSAASAAKGTGYKLSSAALAYLKTGLTKSSPFDVQPEGPANVNIASVIAGAVPHAEPVTMQSGGIASDASRLLWQIGITVRELAAANLIEYLTTGVKRIDDTPGSTGSEATEGVTADRLANDVVEEFLAKYKKTFLGITDADSKAENQKPKIRAAMEKAVRAYDPDRSKEKLGAEFRVFVEQKEELRDAATYLNSLRDLFNSLQALGLSPAETKKVDAILLNDEIRPQGRRVDELKAAIMSGSPKP
ncbi:MAG: filamentous hemagglutinin N-terminal domain-containing protein [Planctomycetota bacterium]|nr:filamentous hemagglutinin N-terminal domain-containing protein [Planctomycetota bacterium]